MDDVDRLFQCFKCGITPPQSAIRERRKKKRKLKQEHSPKLLASTDTEKKLANPKNFDKQFSPVVFYGSPNGVPPKRPARLLRLLHEIRLELAEQSKLREEIWSTFPRQDEAMKIAKQHLNARVFSYQDHLNGQRRFLVSTYKEFWRRYKELNPKFRHHYEVIQEGLPCHLYFDLEFNKKENADSNGDEMVDLLITVVFDAFLQKYSIQGNENIVVELDSSTEEKFSRHLIIHLPNTAFKDNSHVGAFVAEICSRIHSCRDKDETFGKLFISKGSNSATQLFIDTAVYSRNRCFRLPFSSKAGKSSVLLPSRRYKCKDMAQEDEDVFMASLICNISVDYEKLLICKMDLDFVKALHFETEEITNNIRVPPNCLEKFNPITCTNDVSTTYLMGKSPFPDLDAFIEAIASNGNVSGKIRCWYWFSEFGLMVYSMSRNRYCERIGREHKSNHVMYVVDLRRALYYQKCYDPDCRGYRSPMRPVPDDNVPDHTYYLNIAEDVTSHGHANTSPTDDERLLDSCKKDEWWHEAVKFAEKVEQLQRAAFDLTQMDITREEEDENWWMAVENTAIQTELTFLQKV